MTASQPATPGSDSVRAQIAEALPPSFDDVMTAAVEANEAVGRVVPDGFDPDAPLVSPLVRQQFIERLRELTYRWYGQVALEHMADELIPLAAAAYRTNPSSEEKP